MVELPKSLAKLGAEVDKWMDGQRDSQFPWCDTFLMWHEFTPEKRMETYNCTFPYWREHGRTVLEDISIHGSFKEQIEKLVIVRPTEKGFMLPNIIKKRDQIYVLRAEKGKIPIIVGKDYTTLTQMLEVTEYGLYDFKKNTLNMRFEGEHISTGNIWNMNAHLVKGDLIAYVRHHDE